MIGLHCTNFKYMWSRQSNLTSISLKELIKTQVIVFVYYNVPITLQVVYPEDLEPLNDSILRDSSLREEITRTEDREVDLVVTCLFCCYTVPGERAHLQVYAHMRTLHCFDFPEVVSHLSYYTQVKLINYMRRKVKKRLILVLYFCSRQTNFLYIKIALVMMPF